MEWLASAPGGGAARGLLPLAVLGLIVLEALVGWWRGRATYDLGETAATAVIMVGQRLINAAAAPLVLAPMFLAYDHRLFEIAPTQAWSLAALFVGLEFCYYWHHRAMHGWRLMWATHGVHHSSTRLNLGAALRLGWGGAVTGGFIFYLPLALLGFHPFAIFAMLAANLFYQLFLHASWMPHLGPLEWLLNTPRHHHVHHAANASCLDRNFGGVVIVFDRLFRTFAAVPAEPLTFGLSNAAGPSRNPLKVALAGWIDLGRHLGAARSLRAGWAALFGRP
jgi:sterol desaturase/sphingolipid hydroxylase (fatty acid hydroxylase superfamily)